MVSGFGIANVIPAIFSASGRIEGADVGTAMSRVATMGYAGLLIGPPFIGFVAQATSLPAGLSSVVLFTLIIVLGARLLRDDRSHA